MIDSDALVVFVGDSITEAERNLRDDQDLGHGYAGIAAGWFSASYPDSRVRFLNRGIAGDRSGDLRRRWENDVLRLRPDWISILIGINDLWPRSDADHYVSTEANVRAILEYTHRATEARLIVCEPFLLPGPAAYPAWRQEFELKLGALRGLAREFEALYVPLDSFFAAAAAKREPTFWSHDGVHPTPAGHALIAQAWLAAVGAL